MPPNEPIYLDHNATTRPFEEVVEVVGRVMRELWGNPSSMHRFGQMARRELELARESIARDLFGKGVEPSEIVFTSGGTESTNLAINGTLDRFRKMGLNRNVIITTTTEHSAVCEPIDEAGESEDFEVARVGVDRSGVIDETEFENLVKEYAGKIALVSVQWANNETGVIQPIQKLVQVLRGIDDRAVFHTDAIQAAGKIQIKVKAAAEGGVGVDLLSFAGHKFHGPPGVGGLYMRKRLRLRRQQMGGPHERDRRGGTENLPGIVGMAKAAEIMRERMDKGPRYFEKQAALRDQFEAAITSEIADTSINGKDAKHGRLWNTSNIAFHRLEAEAVLIALSERGVYASAGAACSSGSLDPSPVLLAMGIPDEEAHGSIRFSLSDEDTPEQVGRAVEIIRAVISRLIGLHA